MTKSERANASSKSQISFRERPKGDLAQHVENVNTQSATFGKFTGHENMLGEHASVQATISNLREIEVFSLDGRHISDDIRRS